MSQIITGLDIGSSQIKGVVVEKKKNGKLSIISAFKHPSAGIRRGAVINSEDFTGVLRDLILDLQKISKNCTRNLFLNVNSEHIKVRSSKGIVAVGRADREIQQDDIDRVIQASQAVKLLPNFMILHNIVREYFVDDVGDIYEPLGMTGSRLEVGTLIVEAFGPQVDLLVKSVKQAGGDIGGLIFNPLASAKSVLSKKQRELGSLLIDFGFGTTSMVIFEENKVMHAKSLPIGSDYLTKDIAVGLRTSIDVAEKLKLTYGFALSKEISRKDTIKLSEFESSNSNEVAKRFLAEIIEIRLAELLELINNELKALGRNARLPGGVVIVGGGVKLAGLNELVREELKLSTQTGFPDLNLFEITNPTHEDLVDDPEFACSLGLALWGGDEVKSSPAPIKNFFRNLMP